MRNTLVTVMLGMNRFTQRDTKHRFNMGHMRGYNDMWLQSVDAREKTHSTPFYEVSKAVDEVRQEFTEVKDNIAFVFGRGHMGNEAEEDLCETLMNGMRNYGKDSIHIMYGKSYGAVDLLRALKILREKYHQKPSIDLLILIDGYGVSKALTSVSTRTGRFKPRRFIRPPNALRAHSVVQRTKGFHGLMVGSESDKRCFNHVIKKNDVKGKVYDHYYDGHKRDLEACHKHMEEIVSVVPCCVRYNELHTVNELIKITLRKLWE